MVVVIIVIVDVMNYIGVVFLLVYKWHLRALPMVISDEWVFDVYVCFTFM